MKIQLTKKYKKHGCFFQGNLAVINFDRELANHPRNGQFGAMTVFDALDEAKSMMSGQYSDYEILLGIPELVVRLK